MAKLKFKKKSLYLIAFIDYAINGDGVIKCCVCGWVWAEDETSVTLTTWLPISDDGDLVNANVELVHIVKSTILRAKPLN
jgi:hypothetical protein